MPRTAAAKLVALVGMDPSDHEVQRRMLIPSFTVKRVNSPRPAIRRIVVERIEALLAGGRRAADLVPEFALPVPVPVPLPPTGSLLAGPPSGHSERLGPGDPLTERELMLRKELPGRP
ncbi:DUF6059 family protein [Streptomyces sp. NPDC058612]|uniref:DUF6059 family protein n=1 Tax=Streptomyces sp. NPDC058612 TaxID=3346555 RepID=UPI00365AA140